MFHVTTHYENQKVTLYTSILKNGRAIINVIDWHSKTCVNVLVVIFGAESEEEGEEDE